MTGHLRCAIAAAGKGSRSGIAGPKTLCPVGGVPIIVRLLGTLRPYDPRPLIVVSPEGRAQIEAVVEGHGFSAAFVEQPQPLGMGDAVLRLDRAEEIASCDDLLLLWGDIPFAQPDTVETLVRLHAEHRNVFSFPTRHVENCYTYVERDGTGRVIRVVETREQPGAAPATGERDTGMFIFKRDPVMRALRAGGSDSIGRATGEHRFLHVIARLATAGHRVEGYPIARALDVLGFNTPDDLREINEHAAT